MIQNRKTHSQARTQAQWSTQPRLVVVTMEIRTSNWSWLTRPKFWRIMSAIVRRSCSTALMGVSSTAWTGSLGASDALAWQQIWARHNRSWHLEKPGRMSEETLMFWLNAGEIMWGGIHAYSMHSCLFLSLSPPNPNANPIALCPC